MKKRIAIFYPWPNLDTVPSLVNTAELLAAVGYKVDIFTRTGNGFLEPSFNHKSIEVIIPQVRQERKGIYYFIPGRWFYPLQMWKHHLQSRYCCFIGVDPQGLLQAHSVSSSRFIRVPLIYYSLELLLSQELSYQGHLRLKQQEIALSHKAVFIIIQDEERAKLLSIDNHIPLDRFVLVPNAPMGPARCKSSGYWHRQFGLPADVRIVLHAGSLDRWTALEEIMDSVKSWPENWVLVVHTRYHAQLSSEIEKLYKRAIPGRVFFSLKPVARQEYDALVDGADIGIAFYIPTPGYTETQKNIEILGLSSGKIAYYLRAGLPVIINETPSMSRLIQQEGGGVCVREIQTIGEAISQIALNYESYSSQACKLFDKYLDFTLSFQEVIKRINSLEN